MQSFSSIHSFRGEIRDFESMERINSDVKKYILDFMA